MTDKYKHTPQAVIYTIALLFVAGLVYGGTTIILNIIEFYSR